MNTPDLLNVNSSSNSLVTSEGDFSKPLVKEKPLRVLILSQILPYPPDAGPKIKTFNLIKFLAKDFAITLVSFTRPGNTQEDVQELRQYCEYVYCIPLHRSHWRDGAALLRSLFGSKPFLMVRDESRQMDKLLGELVARTDYSIVHADQLNMAGFALKLPAGPKVLDQHNAVWKIMDRLRQGERNPLKRVLLELETYKLRRYEQQVCRRFDAVLAVSDRDALAMKVDCQVIPIGVDASGTTPLNLEPSSLNLVSLGTMFYPPNIEGVLWFAREIFPLILAEVPNATYTIIGPRPPASIFELARRNPNIRVTGYLKDLQPALAASAALIVPLLSGGGMRVKILEALALGLPIISTTIGAESIRLENGRTALLADTPKEFAQACLKILGDFTIRKELAGAGRQLAIELYDYQKAYEPLKAVYSQLLTAPN